MYLPSLYPLMHCISHQNTLSSSFDHYRLESQFSVDMTASLATIMPLNHKVRLAMAMEVVASMVG